MKNGDFPIKHTREICCMVIFPIKNGDFSHEMSICSPVFCVELSTEPTNSFRRSSWQQRNVLPLGGLWHSKSHTLILETYITQMLHVWYIYLQNWVILGQMLVNIPYMEHLGYSVMIVLNYPAGIFNGNFRILNWRYLPYVRPMISQQIFFVMTSK